METSVDYKELYNAALLENVQLKKDKEQLEQIIDEYESRETPENYYNHYFLSDPLVNKEYESLLTKFSDCLEDLEQYKKNEIFYKQNDNFVSLLNQNKTLQIENDKFRMDLTTSDNDKRKVQYNKLLQDFQESLKYIEIMENDRQELYLELYKIQKNSSNSSNRHYSPSRESNHSSTTGNYSKYTNSSTNKKPSNSSSTTTRTHSQRYRSSSPSHSKEEKHNHDSRSHSRNRYSSSHTKQIDESSKNKSTKRSHYDEDVDKDNKRKSEYKETSHKKYDNSHDKRH